MAEAYDSNMPTSYGGGAGDSSSSDTVIDTEFVKGPKGILKAVEAVRNHIVMLK